MPRMRLYSGPLSMFGAKAQIAALEKGLDFDLVMVPFEMKTLYEPKHPEVARINPKRQVPVLVHGDLEIFDSTQIRLRKKPLVEQRLLSFVLCFGDVVRVEGSFETQKLILVVPRIVVRPLLRQQSHRSG